MKFSNLGELIDSHLKGINFKLFYFIRVPIYAIIIGLILAVVPSFFHFDASSHVVSVTKESFIAISIYVICILFIIIIFEVIFAYYFRKLYGRNFNYSDE